MRLHASYSLTLLSKLPTDFQLPLRIEIGGSVFEITELDESREHAFAIVEGSVDPSGLQIRVCPKSLDGSSPSQEIEVPEREVLSHFLSTIISLISFLTDIPIRYAHKLGDQLIAETEEDNRLLESLGTAEVYESLRVVFSFRTFSFSLPEASASSLELLYSKETGLALYAQALLMQESIAVFRELWKILESAFATKDDELVRCLADYEPAKQLGFTYDELRELLILRGRASHADSRVGPKELHYVSAETSNRAPRLKCLVEQVLLTKKTWGITTLDAERIADLTGFINSKTNPVLISRATSRDSGSQTP